MRVMGLLGLVLALAIVGLLVKKQMAATRAPLPTLAPAASAPAGGAPANVRQQSQQMQQQVKEALDAAMQQQQRALPDEAK